MRNRRFLLVGIALMLASYSIILSRALPSSLFLIVFFCWLWVGVSALFDRLEAVKTMAVTITAILLMMSLVVKTTVLGQGDMTAFYSLAVFPSLIAWVCVYVYVRHIQRAEDVSGRMLNNWFEGQDAERLARTPSLAVVGQRFSAEMLSGVSHDNDTALDVGHGPPYQKAVV